MKRIIFLLLASLFTLSAGSAVAQSVSSLRINPDARSGGMGEAGVAMPAGSYSIYQNMAATSFSDSKLAVGYSFTWRTSASLIKNNNLHTLSGFYKINDKHVIGAGFRAFTVPKTELFDNEGIKSGDFRPRDIAVDLGYAYTLTENWSAGVAMRYIYSKIAPSMSDGMFAFDLGVYFNKNDWSAGASIANLGSKVDYGVDTKYDMPTWVNLGAARQFRFSNDHKLLCAVEGSYIFKPSDDRSFTLGMGVEYMYRSLLALRGGYHIGEQGVRGNYATLGLGVHKCGFQFDLAYIIAKSNVPVRNTLNLSLGYRF